jgi:hypothetical protein
MIFLYLLAGLALLGAVVALLPVELRTRYGREGEEDLLRVDLYIWPGVRLGFRLDMIDFRPSLQWSVLSIKGEMVKGAASSRLSRRKSFSAREFIRTLRQLFSLSDLVKTLRPSLRYMQRSIQLTRLAWHTELGTGDPFHTGLAAGAAWSVKGLVVAALCALFRVSQQPLFSVKPHFNKRCLAVTLDCILRTRTGHIIFTGFRIIAALIVSGNAKRLLKMLKKPGRRVGHARTSH